MPCNADGFEYTADLLGHDLDGDGNLAQAVGAWATPGPTLRAWDAGLQKLIADGSECKIGPYYDVVSSSGTVTAPSGTAWPNDDIYFVAFRFPATPSAGDGMRVDFGTCWMQGKFETVSGVLKWVLRASWMNSPFAPVGFENSWNSTSGHISTDPNNPIKMEQADGIVGQFGVIKSPFIACWLGIDVSQNSVLWGEIVTPSQNMFHYPGEVAQLLTVSVGACTGSIGSATYAALGAAEVVQIHEEMVGLPGVYSDGVSRTDTCAEVEIFLTATPYRSPCAAVLTRIQSDGQSYFAMARPGSTQIVYGRFNAAGSFGFFSTATITTALAPGDSGVLKLSSVGPRHTVYWEDVEVASFVDGAISSGAAGLMAFLPPNASSPYAVTGEPSAGAKLADATMFYLDHYAACDCGGGGDSCSPCEPNTSVAHEGFSSADIDELDGEPFDSTPDASWVYQTGDGDFGRLGGKGIAQLFGTDPFEFTVYSAESPAVGIVQQGFPLDFELDHIPATTLEIALYVHFSASGSFYSGYRFYMQIDAGRTRYALQKIVANTISDLQTWDSNLDDVPALAVGTHSAKLRVTCSAGVLTLTPTIEAVDLPSTTDTPSTTLSFGVLALGLYDVDAYDPLSPATPSILLTSVDLLNCGTTIPCTGPPTNPYPWLPPPPETPPYQLWVGKNNVWNTLRVEDMSPGERDVFRKIAELHAGDKGIWRILDVETGEMPPTNDPDYPPFGDPCEILPPLPPGDVVPIPFAGGRFLGAQAFPITLMGPVCNGGKRSVGGYTPGELAQAAARSSVIMGAQGGYNQYLLNGGWNRDYFVDVTYARVHPILSALVTYTGTGTFFGYSAIDDFDSHGLWPPSGVPDADMSYVFTALHSLLPGIRLGMRGRPSQFSFNPGVDFYEAQYKAWMGLTPEEFTDLEYNGGRSRGALVCLNLNYLHGGNGSSGVRVFDGSGLGQSAHNYMCSPLEVADYIPRMFARANAIDGAAYAVGSVGYMYNPEWISYPGMINALTICRNFMAGLPPL